ncbi:hypothetical protein KQH61_05980 [bacterium]|nr:hypothetical protein [bacterium]
MRAFIVGNGPSLKDTPLDLLKDEVCFATNRINLVYGSTSWRPNYYVRAESIEDTTVPTEAWMDDLLVHLRDPDIAVYCNPWFPKKLRQLGIVEDWENLYVIKGCPHYLNHYDNKYCPVLWHLPTYCTYGSSVNVAIQIAVSLGYGPLYLVGCDLGYGKGNDHFDQDYSEGYRQDLRPARYANMDTLNAHMIAKRSSPVDIFNATIGGEMEVYERVDLMELLNG